MSGYNDKDTGCMASLAILPKAYLSWCTNLQRNYLRYQIAKSSLTDGRGAWYITNQKNLEEYRVRTGEDVVRRLGEMYFAGQARSLVMFKDILLSAIEFHRRINELIPFAQRA